MKQISFPEFSIVFTINPVAFTIGTIKIHWYAIVIVCAIFICILLAKKQDGKFHIKFENILECALWTLPIAFIGARIYYILFSLPYYIANPIKILDFKSGGLAIYGGILTAIPVIAFYCKKKKLKLTDFTDYVVPYLALSQSIGRWGNFFNVEAYGIQTTSIFRMGILDGYSYKEVHATFLYESMANF